jgi:hypothetical protein
MGDLVLTGFTNGPIEFGGGPAAVGPSKARFVAKFRGGDGAHVWSRFLHNVDVEPREDEWEGSLAVDAENNVILGGRFFGSVTSGTTTLAPAGGWDVFVLKFAANGDTIWLKSWGGVGYEALRALRADAAGNLIACGDFDSTFSFGGVPLASKGGLDVFLVALTADGAHAWSQRIGGDADERCGRLAVDTNGNALVGGFFQGTATFPGGQTFTSRGDYDAFVSKVSASGKGLWSRHFGGGLYDAVWGVASDASGNVIVCGAALSDVDFGEGVVAGFGSADAFLAKLSATGHLAWSHRIGGAGWDSCGVLATDAQQRIYATGWYEPPIMIGADTLSSFGMYLVQLAP